MKKTYNKLVRDHIPEIIERDGKTAITKTLTGNELQEALFEKLHEEHHELVTDKTVEEIADMIEVLFALASTYGYSEAELLDFVKNKRIRSGGFNNGVWLNRVENRSK